jgi:hypothetical protein
MPASSALTRQRVGWRPTERGLIADLEQMNYLGADTVTASAARRTQAFELGR